MHGPECPYKMSLLDRMWLQEEQNMLKKNKNINIYIYCGYDKPCAIICP